MTTRDETFGGTLKRLRALRGLSQSQLAASTRLAEAYGRSLTSAAVSEWERDQNLPKSRSVVQALDDELGADGELLLAGGYNGPPGTDTEVRLLAIEADGAALRHEVEALRSEMGALRQDLKKLLSQQGRAADS